MPIGFLVILNLPLPGQMVTLSPRYVSSCLGRSLVAIAGPIVSLVLLLLLWNPFIADRDWELLRFIWFRLELIAFCLNLLPLPGLDSYAVIEPWLPQSIRRGLQKIKPLTQWVFIVCLIWWGIKYHFRLTDLGFNPIIETLAKSFLLVSGLAYLGVPPFATVESETSSPELTQTQIAHQQQRIEKDFAIVDQQIRHAPAKASLNLWEYRGYLLNQLARPEALLANYNEALQYHPQTANLWRERGLALAEQRDFEAALTSFAKVIDFGEVTIDDWHYQGDMLLELGRYEVAIAAYDRVLEKSPRYSHILADRGYALYQLGRYAEANDTLDRALDIDPTEPYAIYHKVRTLRQLGEVQAACNTAIEGLKRHPRNPNLTALLVGILEQSKQPELALATYNQVIAHDPQNIALRYGKVMLCLREQRPTEARELLMTVPADQLSVLQLRLRCRLHYQAKDYDRALSDCAISLTQDPENPISLELHGQILTGLGQYAAAIAVYETLLKKYPDYYWVRLQVGQLHGQLQQPEAELAAYETVLLERSDDVDVLYLKALTLIELGRSDTAQVILAEILAIAPDHELAQTMLAELAP
jgi:tetratricopeptide (TPR) repeat protein